MTPLPDAARFFVALPEHAHKAYSESELRQLYGERAIKRDTLIAPVNTTDWKKLAAVFPDWTPLRPVGEVIAPPAAPVSKEPQQPPFLPKHHPLSTGAMILAVLSISILILSLASYQRRETTILWSGEAVFMMKASVVTALLAVGLGIAGGAASRQDAILAALNWQITRRDSIAAKTSEAASPEEK